MIKRHIMKNQVQLVTYVDCLSGGGLAELNHLLNGPLAGIFGGVHLLPFFTPIDGAAANNMNLCQVNSTFLDAFSGRKID